MARIAAEVADVSLFDELRAALRYMAKDGTRRLVLHVNTMEGLSSSDAAIAAELYARFGGELRGFLALLGEAAQRWAPLHPGEPMASKAVVTTMGPIAWQALTTAADLRGQHRDTHKMSESYVFRRSRPFHCEPRQSGEEPLQLQTVKVYSERVWRLLAIVQFVLHPATASALACGNLRGSQLREQPSQRWRLVGHERGEQLLQPRTHQLPKAHRRDHLRISAVLQHVAHGPIVVGQWPGHGH
jgi:hypothetical protein